MLWRVKVSLQVQVQRYLRRLRPASHLLTPHDRSSVSCCCRKDHRYYCSRSHLAVRAMQATSTSQRLSQKRMPAVEPPNPPQPSGARTSSSSSRSSTYRKQNVSVLALQRWHDCILLSAHRLLCISFLAGATAFSN